MNTRIYGLGASESLWVSLTDVSHLAPFAVPRLSSIFKWANFLISTPDQDSLNDTITIDRDTRFYYLRTCLEIYNRLLEILAAKPAKIIVKIGFHRPLLQIGFQNGVMNRDGWWLANDVAWFDQLVKKLPMRMLSANNELYRAWQNLI